MKLATLTTQLIALVVLYATPQSFAALVDTDGNAVTNETALGDIDMGVSTYGELKNGIAPDYNTVSNAAITIANGVTNLTLAGYGYPFSAWTDNQPTLNLTQPVFMKFRNGQEVVYSWKYTSTNELGQVVGDPHYIMSTADGDEALLLNDVLNGTNIVFQRTGTAVYTNGLGLATLENLEPYVKHTQLNTTLNDYVSNETLENYDASYKMVDGISTENQTIQLVMTTENPAGNLEIAIPTNGRCKDWIVYVVSYNADMPIVLPPADYWIRNESITNAITAGIPTALYFSQISSEGVYTMGRQEYIPLTVESTREYRLKSMMNKMSSKVKKATPRSRALNAAMTVPKKKEEESAAKK